MRRTDHVVGIEEGDIGIADMVYCLDNRVATTTFGPFGMYRDGVSRGKFFGNSPRRIERVIVEDTDFVGEVVEVTGANNRLEGSPDIIGFVVSRDNNRNTWLMLWPGKISWETGFPP